MECGESRRHHRDIQFRIGHRRRSQPAQVTAYRRKCGFLVGDFCLTALGLAEAQRMQKRGGVIRDSAAITTINAKRAGPRRKLCLALLVK